MTGFTDVSGAADACNRGMGAGVGAERQPHVAWSTPCFKRDTFASTHIPGLIGEPSGWKVQARQRLPAGGGADSDAHNEQQADHEEFAPMGTSA